MIQHYSARQPVLILNKEYHYLRDCQERLIKLQQILELEANH